jgi:tetratricopeptide (TPR) repeat protein
MNFASRDPQPLHIWLGWFVLGLGVAALGINIGQAVSAHHAANARRLLKVQQHHRALAMAQKGLAWDPYQPHAQYTRLVALKRLRLWDELNEATREAATWHPNGPALWNLAGEAHAQTGHNRAAAEALWEALWRSPTPEFNPSVFWRQAMRSGASAWGDGDPRVAAAAIRMVSLLGEDRQLTVEDRRRSLAEAAEALERAAAPLTAQAIRNIESRSHPIEMN